MALNAGFEKAGMMADGMAVCMKITGYPDCLSCLRRRGLALFSLLGLFFSAGQFAGHSEPTIGEGCKASGRQDVFILLDVSGSMTDYLQKYVDFIQSKAKDLDAGTVDVVAFNTDWVALNPEFGADFRVTLAPNDEGTKCQLFYYLQPTGDLPCEPRISKWPGLSEAGKALGNGGTDIGQAIDRALDVLSARLYEQEYTNQTVGQQLWVLTDSQEETNGPNYPIQILLDRMKQIQTKIWFQYHEIMLVPPQAGDFSTYSKYERHVRDVAARHMAITNAGFSVDDLPDFGQRVKTLPPWPMVGGRPDELAASLSLPCGDSIGGQAVVLDQPLTFETCGRAPGTFQLSISPKSVPVPGLNLSLADEFGTGLFGQPVQRLRIAGNWGIIPPGASLDTVWRIAYSFTPEISPSQTKPIVDPLAAPSTLLRLHILRAPVPQVTWQVSQPGAGNEIAAGAQAATVRFAATNLSAPAQVSMSLASEPAGMLAFEGVAGATNFELSPETPEKMVAVISGKSDFAHAVGTLSVQAGTTAGCGPLLESNGCSIVENFTHRVKVFPPWPMQEGEPTQLTGKIGLSCEESDGSQEVTLDQPLTFETISDLGGRAPGTFKLNMRPVSVPVEGLNLSLPDEINAGSFGQPLQRILVAGNWGIIPPGASIDTEWTVEYSFTPDLSPLLSRPIVDSLPARSTLLHLHLSRAPLPQISWKVLRQDASGCLTPGAEVAELQFSATNLASPVNVAVSVRSRPNGIIYFDNGAEATNFALGPGLLESMVRVISSKSDDLQANASIGVRADAPEDCRVLLDSNACDLNVCFAQSAQFNCLGADNGESIKLRAFGAEKTDWVLDPVSSQAAKFRIYLPKAMAADEPFEIKVNGDLQYAVRLVEEGQLHMTPTNQLMITSQGVHVFKLVPLTGADSDTFHGQMKIMSPRGQLLNGKTGPVEVNIEAILAAPPKI